MDTDGQILRWSFFSLESQVGARENVPLQLVRAEVEASASVEGAHDYSLWSG